MTVTRFVWKWMPVFTPRLHEALALLVALYTYIVSNFFFWLEPKVPANLCV